MRGNRHNNSTPILTHRGAPENRRDSCHLLPPVGLWPSIQATGKNFRNFLREHLKQWQQRGTISKQSKLPFIFTENFTIMTSTTSTHLSATWPVSADAVRSDAPVTLAAGAPLGALSMICDSFRVLSAVAFGKRGRAAQQDSAAMCALMDRMN